MAQETIEIDIRAWLVRILKNWYWFLLSAMVFGILGTYGYFSTTYKFEVKSEIMLRVPMDYPNLKKIELDINYRCAKPIIDAAQRLITHNENRFPKNIRPDIDRKQEGNVEYFLFENQYGEIQYILKKIEEQTL